MAIKRIRTSTPDVLNWLKDETARATLNMVKEVPNQMFLFKSIRENNNHNNDLYSSVEDLKQKVAQDDVLKQKIASVMGVSPDEVPDVVASVYRAPKDGEDSGAYTEEMINRSGKLVQIAEGAGLDSGFFGWLAAQRYAPENAMEAYKVAKNSENSKAYRSAVEKGFVDQETGSTRPFTVNEMKSRLSEFGDPTAIEQANKDLFDMAKTRDRNNVMTQVSEVADSVYTDTISLPEFRKLVLSSLQESSPDAFTDPETTKDVDKAIEDTYRSQRMALDLAQQRDKEKGIIAQNIGGTKDEFAKNLQDSIGNYEARISKLTTQMKEATNGADVAAKKRQIAIFNELSKETNKIAIALASGKLSYQEAKDKIGGLENQADLAQMRESVSTMDIDASVIPLTLGSPDKRADLIEKKLQANNPSKTITKELAKNEKGYVFYADGEPIGKWDGSDDEAVILTPVDVGFDYVGSSGVKKYDYGEYDTEL